MTEVLKIGEKARKLDEKRISERLKVNRTMLSRIGLALLFYFGILSVMNLLL